MSASGLTIVKAKLEVPEGQRYRPNNSTESRRFEAFYSLYKKLYPDKDEREPKRRMLGIASSRTDDEGAVTTILYALNKDGRLVGYNQIDVITHGPIEDGAFGIDWYLGVDHKEQRQGYGSIILRATVGYMKNVAIRRGRGLELVHAELDDPERMNQGQKESSGRMMEPHARIAFWAANGFMEVVIPENGKVNREWYIQPRMTDDPDQEPVEYLLSSMKPLHPELQRDKEMSADVFLKRFLWKYVYYGFESIPWSDLDGLRNPDTDPSYLEMKRRVELAGKVRLVPLER